MVALTPAGREGYGMDMIAPLDRSGIESPACIVTPGAAPLVSVVIKCYNEESHIAACVESVLAATAGLDAEVIVADALSTDRTVEIARRYPVMLARMTDPRDRGCGATARMGQQYARGTFLLLVDGDMEVLPDFLPAALAAMTGDPSLAGVGGQLIEMSESLEFQERRRRGDHLRPDPSPRRLTGSALYRMEAIRDAGYFMNRNLYCGEELELGQRLRAKGWRLRSLPVEAVRHHGHEAPPVTLLRARWRSRYFDGYGQLLRGALGKPWFWETARVCALYLCVSGWWGALAALTLASLAGYASPWAFLAAALAPVVVIAARKRRLGLGCYTFLLWQFHAAAFLRGLFRPWPDPGRPVSSTLIGCNPA